MTTPLRVSPTYELLQTLDGTWARRNGMPALIALPGEAANTRLGLADLSFLTRFGVKGPGAAAWLASQGVTVSDRPNSWVALPHGGLVARLGNTEFLVEDSLESQIATNLLLTSRQPPEQVYPVLRQDLAIGLYGEAVKDLLLETCNINFQALNPAEHPVVLTTMVGVGVTVIPGQRSGIPYYRLWCDSTFGGYFWQTLSDIARELGGGIVGSDFILQRTGEV